MGNCFELESDDVLRPGPDPASSARPTDDNLGPEGRRAFKGARVNVYKQDPTVKYVGLREQWLPVDIYTGPRTREVEIQGISRQYGPTDDQGNFLYDPERYPEAFDAVNTLTIIHNVIWMYKRALNKIKSGKQLKWLWGDRPLRVYPRAGRRANAFYSRQEKALKFFYFDDRRQTIYSCRSWDIVAHETGHAVLDSLKPGWMGSSTTQTNALHESFGDITAILSILDQLDMCEIIVAKTKGQLHDPNNFLAAIGEEFGSGRGKRFGLRNAHVDVKISQVRDQQHELSTVFTGAVYDFLVRVFTNTVDMNKRPPAQTLHTAADHVASLFLLAILNAPDRNATFRDVADQMVRNEPQRVFKGFLQVEFGRREIFDPGATPRPMKGFDAEDDSSIRCGTHAACTDASHAHSVNNNASTTGYKPPDRRNNSTQVDLNYRQQPNDDRRRNLTGDSEAITLSDLPVFEEEPSRRWSRSPPGSPSGHWDSGGHQWGDTRRQNGNQNNNSWDQDVVLGVLANGGGGSDDEKGSTYDNE